MKLTRRHALLGTAALIAAPASFAQASAWPSRPIRIVVPYPPGGSSDIIARSISTLLADSLKQSVIVENKAGANGNLGTDFVAKSQADGHTFVLCDDNCGALQKPETLEEVKAALEHWRDHSFLGGCSHGD